MRIGEKKKHKKKSLNLQYLQQKCTENNRKIERSTSVLRISSEKFDPRKIKKIINLFLLIKNK